MRPPGRSPATPGPPPAPGPAIAPPTGHPLALAVFPKRSSTSWPPAMGMKPCRTGYGGPRGLLGGQQRLSQDDCLLPICAFRRRGDPAPACRDPRPQGSSQYRRDRGRNPPHGRNAGDPPSPRRCSPGNFPCCTRWQRRPFTAAPEQALSRAARCPTRGHGAAQPHSAWCRTTTSSRGPKTGPPASR